MTSKYGAYVLSAVLFLQIATHSSVYGFNIEHREPMVKKAPEGQKNSYFGFSVALHQTQAYSSSNDDNWILVGAPLGQNLQQGTNYSGALFKCPISDDDYDCVQVETDGQRQSGGRYLFNLVDYDDEDGGETHGLLPPQPDEIKNGQWLGVSVRSQKPGGHVMVCAHRYIQSQDLSKFHYGQGLCYVMDKNLKTTDSIQYCKGLPTEKLHQQFGFCQIGTSLSFVGDSALVGAPGPYTWRGTVFGQVVDGDFLDRDKTIYRGPLNDNPKPIDKYSYLGMSVGGGHIFDKNRYTYVSGAPRSEMVGQVYFFEKSQKVPPSEELNIPLIITGEQFASSFGYEILVADLNNDGFDDLLVGAPFYYAENKGGAVYAYYNLRGCNFDNNNCTWNAVFYGTEQSRFGFAMTSIGDINKDGYNDVAIGAPYHLDRGAVYIYLGSSKGLKPEPSQVIKVRQLKTFGYSLSGGLDMDNNGYPDLLVGAYESERALLFLTRPIIDIKINIRSLDMHNINATKKGCADDPNNVNNTCFSFTSCFTIIGHNKKFEKFTVLYRITEIQKIIPRIWFRNMKHPDQTKNENTLPVEVTSLSQPYCLKEVVYIKKGISDILSPLKFKVKYTLEDDSKPHTPILNTTSLKEFEATFQKDCGDDDVCTTYLDLLAGTNFEKSDEGEYTINMVDQEFILEANITNRAESAYEAKLFIFHPTALSYIISKTAKEQSNVKCELKTDSLVVCDLGNPLYGNTSVNLKIRFEILKNTKEQKLDLTLKVNSTSKETSPRTEVKLSAILQKIADFSITGKGSTNVFYGGEVKGASAMQHLEDIGARIIHRYYLDNRGQWDLPNIKVNVQWPYQVKPSADNQEGKWLLYLEEEPKILGVAGDVTGFCKAADPAVINPLKLALLTSASEEPENLMLPPDFFNDNDNDNDNDTSLRRRRDAEFVVDPQEVEKGGVKRRVIVMECNETARCTNIECYITGLKKHNQAYVEIKSRIWNATLVENYNNVDWVQIHSYAQVDILDPTFITKPEQIFATSAETLLYPSTVPSIPSINLWIILAAVLAGILVLIVLILVLYKCGFFKRKRVKDETLSGNLQKQEESNSLLKN